MRRRWTLTVGGVEKTLAEWGIQGLRKDTASLAQDVVTFGVDGNFLAAQFTYMAAISIYHQPEDADGNLLETKTRWFTGLIIKVHRQGAGASEAIRYVAANLWWYLDNLIYEQEWKYPADINDANSGLVTQSRSHLFLGSSLAGERITVGAVISEIVQYANGAGAPLQLALGGFPLYVPYDEVRDVTCAECIRRQLRWTPDAVSWVDYTTNPPTLHIARKAELAIAALGVTEFEDVNATPRYDLLVPAVVLKYEQTHTVDQTTWVTVVKDVAPPGATEKDFGVLAATIDLQGSTASYASAKIECGVLDINSLAWWKQHLGWLKDSRITDLLLSAPARDGQQNLPRELLDGGIADWMGFATETETVTCKASYKVRDIGGQVIKHRVDEILNVPRVISTNATTGSYTSLQNSDPGEPLIVGLAQYLYDAVGTLQYEGSCMIVEQEVSGVVRIGMVLNITGGLSEWAGMKAVIQQVSEEVDEGRTTITFGPASHLGAADIIEWLRGNRQRNIKGSANGRSTGKAGSGKLSLADKLANNNGNSGGGSLRKLVISNDTARIILDPDVVSGKSALADKNITLVEVEVCENGNLKKMLVLGSIPY